MMGDICRIGASWGNGGTLNKHCTINADSMHRRCTSGINALSMHHPLKTALSYWTKRRTTSVPPMYHRYATEAPPMYHRRALHGPSMPTGLLSPGHDCTISAPPLHHQCTSNAPSAQRRVGNAISDGNDTVRKLEHQVPPMYHRCTTDAPPMQHRCTTDVTSMRHQCIISATSMRLQCAINTIRPTPLGGRWSRMGKALFASLSS